MTTYRKCSECGQPADHSRLTVIEAEADERQADERGAVSTWVALVPGIIGAVIFVLALYLAGALIEFLAGLI